MCTSLGPHGAVCECGLISRPPGVWTQVIRDLLTNTLFTSRDARVMRSLVRLQISR